MTEPEPQAEVTPEEILARAEAVLDRVPEWIWDGERLPVPVEEIADTEFGLLIRDVEDMSSAPGAPDLAPGQTLSGLLLAARGEIWVNAAEAREWPPRRRFTIGHELGHWVMHRDGQTSLFCRSTAVEPDADQLSIDQAAPAKLEDRPDLPPPEREANAFAAALLMPAHLIRARYKQIGASENRFPQLCLEFGASGAAMGRRLHSVIGPGAADGGATGAGAGA